MERQTATYFTHARAGLHDCGANYGFLGKHPAFTVSYRCPCGALVPVEQCAAWPVTDKDCPMCYLPITMSLPESRVKVTLR